MRRLAVVAAACVLLGACSTRALRAHEDPWEGDTSAESAVFLGYHGRLERPPANVQD